MENYDNNLDQSIGELIISKNLALRQVSRERRKKYKKINNNRAVASWIKEDRMIKSVGYEFTIIMRTKGCKWACSESGGCSMCGYFNDSGDDQITEENLVNQFISAVEKNSDRIKEIEAENGEIALKIFTSGSFLDIDEIPIGVQEAIFKKIIEIKPITEVIVESRPEFVLGERLKPLKDILGKISLEIGVGVESSNNYVREVLVNKGFSFAEVESAVEEAHSCDVRIKAYLLLKPPFLTEKIAIIDAVNSIKDVIKIGVDTISLNPVNIQKYTMAESLVYKKQFRSPWIYSVIEVFQKALTKEDLKKVLVVCDPSAAGMERGVHNCYSRDCNQTWLKILREFVHTQDLDIIDPSVLPYTDCKCWNEYNLYKDSINI